MSSTFTGKIIKGIGGFYYVYVEGHGIYECHAKGLFRKDGVKPLVGDDVEIEEVTNTDVELAGSIVKLLERRNQLIRPAVANVDQAMVVFSMANPDPNLNLLDRFLISMEVQGIPTIIVFSKSDLLESADAKKLMGAYEKSGSEVVCISVKEDTGIDSIRSIIKGKTTVLAGPSGVGKSSLLNALMPEANSETGDISRKLKRGKHTTRHSEIFPVDEGTYLFDTPGFSSLYVDLDKEEIKDYYQEFSEYEDGCKFLGCLHYKEPVCGVKEAVRAGSISSVRYENYIKLLEDAEAKSSNKYR